MAFMQELRCLFALMVGSTRRFVDPSAAVELLRDAFRTSEAQQVPEQLQHPLCSTDVCKEAQFVKFIWTLVFKHITACCY